MAKKSRTADKKRSSANVFSSTLSGVVNKIAKFAVVCIVVFVAYNLIDGQIELSQKRETLSLLEKQKQELMLSNEEKKELIDKSDEDEFVEQIAREYFGFAYPDEQIYIDISGS